MRQKHNDKQLSLVVDRIESYDAIDAPTDECDKVSPSPDLYTLPLRAAFLPRDAVLVRYMLSSCVRPSVRPPVRHMPVLYRNDWTNRAVFLPWRLRSTYPTLCFKEIWVSPKLGTSLWDFAPKLSTWKILPRQVDRVINETHYRRRRRSSLLTTPIGQSTSRSTVTL